MGRDMMRHIYYPSKNFKTFKVLFAHDFYVHRASINRPYRMDVGIRIRFFTHKAPLWDGYDASYLLSIQKFQNIQGIVCT